jgi:hypothetical protein
LSIFSTGPNGEGIINSTPCAVTIGNEARRCRSSIYNCSTSALWGLDLAKSFQFRKGMIGCAGLTLETRFGEVKLEEE